MTQAAAIAGACAAALSALALYAGSAHCRWRVPGTARRRGRALGLVLAAASLAAWIAALGIGAGLCVMLACWMLGLVALPYLAALGRSQAR